MKRLAGLLLLSLFVVGAGVSCKREIPESSGGRKVYSQDEWNYIQKENQKYYGKLRSEKSK